MNDTVVAHDPSWAEAFKAEAKVISSALAGMPIALHHIGSTAIPNILAKPIIDILGVVPQFDALDTRSAAMQGAGYQVMGAYGIDGRRYFRKLNPEGRLTHHLHVFLEGSQHITRHLAFRDFLTHYPETAAAYSALKAQLTGERAASWDAYLAGKQPFIERTEKIALEWYCKIST